VQASASMVLAMITASKKCRRVNRIRLNPEGTSVIRPLDSKRRTGLVLAGVLQAAPAGSRQCGLVSAINLSRPGRASRQTHARLRVDRHWNTDGRPSETAV